MELVKVVIQSLEDAKNGKPIVEGSTVEKTEECKSLTVGILEGGTKSGKTSLMFCLRMEDGSVKIAQMTANHFEMLHGSLRGAIQRFGK